MATNHYLVIYQIIPWPNKYKPGTKSVVYDSQHDSRTEVESANRRDILEHHLENHPEIEPVSIYETVEYKGERTFKSLVCWYRKEVL